jgi:hypothetical protein
MSERKGRWSGGRDALDGAYQRADRAIDRGQRHVFRLLWVFLPDTSIAKDARFQQIMASRFFSDAGQQAVTYGALIAVVRGGGSTLEAALVGVAALVPPALFGLYGGAVADALPKRVALAAVYNLQALLCFVVPAFIGTDLYAVLFLIFAVHTLGQVSGPSESSVVPLVASNEQLASATSLVALASNVGTAFGTALLAPILVHLLGERAVFTAAGVMLLIAASRVFDLTTQHRVRPIDWRRPDVRVGATIRWLAQEPAVATMIFVAVLVGTANVVVTTLAPRYVQAVLHVDPADAVYVFAPSALGLLLALVAAPPLIRFRGERVVALGGFVLTACVLSLLGLADQLADAIDPANPLRALTMLNAGMNPELRTAGVLALPLGFGLSLTTTSVHTYINRRVPLSYQGRAFALQSTLKNGAAILPLLGLGAASAQFGVANVLVASPIVLLVVAVGLVQLSFAFSGRSPVPRIDVLSTYWIESDAAVGEPSGTAAPRPKPHHDDEHQGA